MRVTECEGFQCRKCYGSSIIRVDCDCFYMTFSAVEKERHLSPLALVLRGEGLGVRGSASLIQIAISNEPSSMHNLNSASLVDRAPHPLSPNYQGERKIIRDFFPHHSHTPSPSHPHTVSIVNELSRATHKHGYFGRSFNSCSASFMSASVIMRARSRKVIFGFQPRRRSALA